MPRQWKKPDPKNNAEVAALNPKIQIPSHLEELEEEVWENLRFEGRLMITRRLRQGWKLTFEVCLGPKCDGSPLIAKNGVSECTVCGGTGNGRDGVYSAIVAQNITLDELASEEKKEDEPASLKPILVTTPKAKSVDLARPMKKLQKILPDPAPVDKPAIKVEMKTNGAKTAGNKNVERDAKPINVGPPMKHSAKPESEMEKTKEMDAFEKKRLLLSKEINRRMLEGWLLLDAHCPICVTPLMSMGQRGPDVCITCDKEKSEKKVRKEDPVKLANRAVDAALGLLRNEQVEGADAILNPVVEEDLAPEPEPKSEPEPEAIEEQVATKTEVVVNKTEGKKMDVSVLRQKKPRDPDQVAPPTMRRGMQDPEESGLARIRRSVESGESSRNAHIKRSILYSNSDKPKESGRNSHIKRSILSQQQGSLNASSPSVLFRIPVSDPSSPEINPNRAVVVEDQGFSDSPASPLMRFKTEPAEPAEQKQPMSKAGIEPETFADTNASQLETNEVEKQLEGKIAMETKDQESSTSEEATENLPKNSPEEDKSGSDHEASFVEEKKEELPVSSGKQTVTLELPANFDFSDEAKLKELLAQLQAQKGGKVVEKDESRSQPESNQDIPLVSEEDEKKELEDETPASSHDPSPSPGINVDKVSEEEPTPDEGSSLKQVDEAEAANAKPEVEDHDTQEADQTSDSVDKQESTEDGLGMAKADASEPLSDYTPITSKESSESTEEGVDMVKADASEPSSEDTAITSKESSESNEDESDVQKITSLEQSTEEEFVESEQADSIQEEVNAVQVADSVPSQETGVALRNNSEEATDVAPSEGDVNVLGDNPNQVKLESEESPDAVKSEQSESIQEEANAVQVADSVPSQETGVALRNNFEEVTDIAPSGGGINVLGDNPNQVKLESEESPDAVTEQSTEEEFVKSEQSESIQEEVNAVQVADSVPSQETGVALRNNSEEATDVAPSEGDVNVIGDNPKQVKLESEESPGAVKESQEGSGLTEEALLSLEPIIRDPSAADAVMRFRDDPSISDKTGDPEEATDDYANERTEPTEEDEEHIKYEPEVYVERHEESDSTLPPPPPPPPPPVVEEEEEEEEEEELNDNDIMMMRSPDSHEDHRQVIVEPPAIVRRTFGPRPEDMLLMQKREQKDDISRKLAEAEAVVQKHKAQESTPQVIGLPPRPSTPSRKLRRGRSAERRMLPPRPEDSPRNKQANKAPMFTGGPFANGGGTSRSRTNSPSRSTDGVGDNASVVSGMSRASSVASDALETLLMKIEDAKANLAESQANGDLDRQVEMAHLIEKLASAAVAVKKLEEISNMFDG